MKIRTKCPRCGQMNMLDINSLIGLSTVEIQLLRQYYEAQGGSFPVTQESIAALDGKQGWISVKDRLPEKSGIYLIYAPSADTEKPLIATCWFEYARGWSTFDPWIRAISHWMPLGGNLNGE